jgi:DNA-binding LacI/PurR family transcriptional regulator
MRAIAKRAGVSGAIVSRVINGSPPGEMATMLKYGRRKSYGLLIPDIRNPFYSDFLRSLKNCNRNLPLTSPVGWS